MRQGIVTRYAGLLALMSIAGGIQSQKPASDEFQISVDVDLVVLQATVRDRKGSFAPDLNERDFQIYEDGVRQSVRLFRHEDIPVTAGLVIDHSGSMLGKLPLVIQAARTFARSSNQKDQMFVVNFSDKVTLGLSGAMPFTDRPEELDAAIARMPAAGKTALYDAVVRGLNQLKTGAWPKKVLVVVSDGGDNASVLGLPAVVRQAEKSDVMIYTIGIFDDDDPDRNPRVLRSIARATGGEAFFPGHPDEVVAICESIASEIRHQYTLGYVSSNLKKSATYRNIRVTASASGHGKLRVRARAGYLK